MTNIDGKLARPFESASADLIARIRKANWRTPKPWEARVLPNLDGYHKGLEKAIEAFQAGDIMPITLAAATYAGLSKDLDLDSTWMTKQHQVAVQEAVEKVVAVADQIHRLGYEAQTIK